MPVPRLFFICLNTLVLTLAEFFGLDAWNKKTVNHLVDCFFCCGYISAYSSTAACAAAKRAMGTRKGEQLT